MVDASSNQQKVGFYEEAITFVSGDEKYKETLHGTLLIPNQPGRKAGIVLAHGSVERGQGKGGNQTAIRKEAEVFAKAGIVTLIYNKRSIGYSKTNRSYPLLAQDLINGVKLLQTRSDMNEKVPFSLQAFLLDRLRLLKIISLFASVVPFCIPKGHDE